MDITDSVNVVYLVPAKNSTKLWSGIQKAEDIRVGYWRYFCCELDLDQIKTNVELEAAREDFDPPNPWSVRVFKTKDEAMKDMGPNCWKKNIKKNAETE